MRLRAPFVHSLSDFVAVITYCFLDVEVDGPTPGANSMLGLGFAAFDEYGRELDVFEVHLETLEGASCAEERPKVPDPEFGSVPAVAAQLPAEFPDGIAWKDPRSGRVGVWLQREAGDDLERPLRRRTGGRPVRHPGR